MAILSLVGVFINCGSLLNELERIKNKATATIPDANIGPVVLYTLPADGAIAATAQAYIDVVFDQPVEAASALGSPGQGSCAGSVVASADGFTTCGGVASTSGNTVRLTASPTMPLGVSIKVKVSTSLRGTNGMAATAYESPAGFSFAAPCGQNCFYSDSAPTTAASGAGGHSFIIPSGTKAGWILTVNGGGTTSTYWDPATNQTSIGPTLCGAVNNGAHSFEVKTLGGARSGKIITYAGAATGTTCMFDPDTNLYAAGPGVGGGAVNTGAMTIPILTGGNAGKYLLIEGGATVSYLYDVAADNFTVTPSVGASPGVGAHWLRYDAGPQIGNPFIVPGNGSTATRYYNEASNSFASLYTSAGPLGAGSFSFKVNSGPLVNRFLIANGGNTPNSVGYDQNGGAMAGPTLCLVNSGAQWAELSSGPRSGQNFILCGGNSQNYMFYDQPTNTPVTLTSLTGVIGADSSMTKITTGPHTGKYFIVNGNVTRNTSMFDPDADSFWGTRMFKSPGAGSNGFAIKSGTKAGRVLIYAGGTTLGTSLYSAQTGLLEQGPDLSAAAGGGSNPIAITTGSNAGFTYIFTAGGVNTLQKYNPNTNAWTAAVLGTDYNTAPANKGAGSKSLLIPSGPQTNNYLVLNGGGNVNADYFNTSTNTFSSAGAVTGCASINTGSWIFQIQIGANTGKYMIICGAILGTSIFDPSGPSFTAGPSLVSGTPVVGAHGFNISTGTNAGKFLFFPGTGNNTRLYDPVSNTWGAGPIMTPCAGAIQGAGGFAMGIAAGVHAGKALVVVGGDSTVTCYFDPATNSFSTGPVTGPHAGYAVGAESFAFQYKAGIYPTAYFIAHGGASTVVSHWFAY